MPNPQYVTLTGRELLADDQSELPPLDAVQCVGGGDRIFERDIYV